MIGTTIFIIIVITEEKHKFNCSEGSQVVPARPSGKSRLEARQSVGEMKQVR
jgi:hypothetical protein